MKKQDSTEKQITKIEKYINMIWGVLARNWGKLIVLSLLTILVWFCYLVKNQVEQLPTVPEVQDKVWDRENYYGNPAAQDSLGTDTASYYNQ